MRFEWDKKKNRANKRKHDVSFELAIKIFDDPKMHSVPDDYEGEERWVTIGMVRGVLILTVIHTWKGEGDEEIIRVISARKATPSERESYENQHAKS